MKPKANKNFHRRKPTTYYYWRDDATTRIKSITVGRPAGIPEATNPATARRALEAPDAAGAAGRAAGGRVGHSNARADSPAQPVRASSLRARRRPGATTTSTVRSARIARTSQSAAIQSDTPPHAQPSLRTARSPAEGGAHSEPGGKSRRAGWSGRPAPARSKVGSARPAPPAPRRRATSDWARHRDQQPPRGPSAHGGIVAAAAGPDTPGMTRVNRRGRVPFCGSTSRRDGASHGWGHGGPRPTG